MQFNRSGASHVVANDIDPNCRLALDLNAEMCKQSLEGVEMLEADLLSGDTDIRREVLSSTDVLLVGDMFYDEHIGSEVFDLCNTFKGLKRENEVICKIVIFIIKSESSEPEILLLFPSSLPAFQLPAWFRPSLVEESRRADGDSRILQGTYGNFLRSLSDEVHHLRSQVS